MKRTITTIFMAALFAGLVITSCKSPSEKIKDAKENLSQANDKLDKAIADSIESERKQLAMEISKNEITIVQIREKIAKENSLKKAKYEEFLGELEKRNNELKQELIDYKVTKAEDWYKFKTEFKSDVDKLGDAFANFFN